MKNSKVKLNWFQKVFSAILNLSICGHCGDFNPNRGHYIRGYNNMCTQAAGDTGYYCYGCGKISWEKTYDEYVKSCPDWITPYKFKVEKLVIKPFK